VTTATTLPTPARAPLAGARLAELLPAAEPPGVPRPHAPQVLAAIATDQTLSLPALGGLAVALGRYPDPITRHHLQTAGTPPGLVDQVLAELLAGRWLTRPRTLPIGCYIVVDEEVSRAYELALLPLSTAVRWARPRLGPPEDWPALLEAAAGRPVAR
jgi:hypothetical protein